MELARGGWSSVAAMLILGFVLVGTAGADAPATLFKSLEVQASLVKLCGEASARARGVAAHGRVSSAQPWAICPRRGTFAVRVPVPALARVPPACMPGPMGVDCAASASPSSSPVSCRPHHRRRAAARCCKRRRRCSLGRSWLFLHLLRRSTCVAAGQVMGCASQRSGFDPRTPLASEMPPPRLRTCVFRGRRRGVRWVSKSSWTRLCVKSGMRMRRGCEI